MKVSVEGEWGVVDGLGLARRQAMSQSLNTETAIVGNRLKFKPTVFAILHLRDARAKFGDECRATWGGLFKTQKQSSAVFKFKTKPYKHQLEGFDYAKKRKYYALFWEMGLGKTKTALDIAAYKYSMHTINALLVVTLNGVHRNWVRKEAPVHLAIDNYDAAFWNTDRVEGGMRGLIESPNFVLATINFNSTHTKRGEQFCKKFLTSRRAMMVVDESHGIKTPSAQCTRAAIRLSRLAVCRMIMTGTPVANSPLDLFKQFEFLSPTILQEKNYTSFKRRYSIMQDVEYAPLCHARGIDGKRLYQKDGSPVMVPVQEVVGYRDVEELKALIDPHSSRKTKAECLDLPPKVYRRHEFALPPAYRIAYKQMVRDTRIQLQDNRSVTAKIALTKMLKLQQLCCGFVVPDDLDPFENDIRGEPFAAKNPRIEALLDVLEMVQGKAIIWVTFRYSIAEIENALVKKYGRETVVTFSGMTSNSDRDKAEDDFQDMDSPVRWMIAQPQAGGTGRTFTAARDVIYYNNSYSLILRLQSEDRAHRIGQVGTVTYTDLEAIDTVDAKIIDALKKKINLASEITGDDLVDWLSES